MHYFSNKKEVFSKILRQIKFSLHYSKLKGPHILLYHSFFENQNIDFEIDKWKISKTILFDHLSMIKNNFEPISLSDYANAIEQNKPINKKWVIITIDDGFKNVIDYAMPLFEEFEIPWTFSVPVFCVEKNIIPWATDLLIVEYLIKENNNLTSAYSIINDYVISPISKQDNLVKIFMNNIYSKDKYACIEALKSIIPNKRYLDLAKIYRLVTWDDLRTISRNKLLSLAIHGGYHYPLNDTITDEDLYIEIIESKRILEQEIGKCDTFSLPGGFINKDTLLYLEDSGYKVCLTSGSSYNFSFNNSKIIGIPRIVSEYTSQNLLWKMCFN